MGFPFHRGRRLRKNNAIRRIVRETNLSLDDLILPFFVVPGKKVKREVPSMPGIFQVSVDTLLRECKEIVKLGIPGVIIFGIPKRKDIKGSEAYSRKGIVQEACRELKREYSSELVVITDVCLCEYTSHGHCGILNPLGIIDNDKTLEVLGRTALSHAEAGADIVAPSDMMDGRVGAIRRVLEKNGYHETIIMAYSAKYASGFYSPFREAAESMPSFGDRKFHQMDFGNSDEAIREVGMDIEEGADIVMIKPALSYLDIIHRIKEKFFIPVSAFNVSGEYSMVKAAAKNGWIEERKIVMEILTSIKRAGADIIITYHAKDVANWLKS